MYHEWYIVPPPALCQHNATDATRRGVMQCDARLLEATAMFELDEDTHLKRNADGAYEGALSDRWSIGHVPNGGYLLAVAMAGLRQALPKPDPLTVTAHYLRPGVPGPVRVEVETIKNGRSFAAGMARLVQADGEALRVLATYGELAVDDVRHADGAPPALPPRNPTVAPRGGGSGEAMSIRDRFEIQMDPATTGFLRGERAARAELRGWLRFADGRMPDVHAMGLIADAFPPAVFQVAEYGWVPTLELTVHVRARPRTEWLACVFRTRFLQNGLLEEDGEMWDETGTLVAMSRQLAAPPRPIRS